MTDIEKELLERLHKLENLNPDLTSWEIDRIFYLAENAGRDFFQTAVTQTEKLVDMYLGSQVKVLGGNIMEEYFAQLEQAARLLRDAGEIKAPLPSVSNTFSTALVPREQMEALDFCKILHRGTVPKQLVKAADAYRRRNLIVDAVTYYAFKVLWIIDREAAANWFDDLFQRQDGNIDPDIARDALASTADAAIPQRFVKWALRFAADINLLEYWPAVTKLADDVLCKSALRAWYAGTKPRNNIVAQLGLYIRNGKLEEDRLLNWCKNALAEIGNSVQRFMELYKEGLDEKWRAVSLYSELRRMAELYIPVLLTADKLLILPDGAEQLAMAFMGLAGQAREKWETSLENIAFRAVKRTLIMDMKYGRTPVETIRKLTFGDQLAFNMAYSELDLGSEKFDSISQRDKIARFLSIFYASFRRPQLLGVEVARRYRNLMKMIHEDFLSQVLDDTQLSYIRQINILPEIASITAEARKFLAKRKADKNSLEEMLAAKISFEQFVRKKRIQLASVSCKL